ncbi:hypothetical protein HK105_209275 [Polyrhizophydium stewartii]|uniref:Uncharacterized protein n=1 Tax=Polyrhizophydium stewartii TaxID=2732419 RepID=A0ABR4MVH1_9FUNG|nr:high-affinity Zn(2+) transporter zrt1 [Polyrhizophydium stewartii]
MSDAVNTTVPVDAPAVVDDPCAAAVAGDFDRPMHIAAIFIIMGTSFLGTMLPIVGKRFVRSQVGSSAITLLKLFGAGVILATSLVHMFTPANETLTNACLPPAFSKSYKSFAAVFAIAGIFATHLLQLYAGQMIRKQQESASMPLPAPATIVVHKQVDAGAPLPVEASSSSSSNGGSDAGEQGMVTHHEGHTHGGVMLHSREKQLVVFLLELGIASHSVIIGVTLGNATDEFRTLLVALCFHQFFEGLALSAIVMEAEFKRWTMAVGMVVFYTLTTPMGIALGIALRESFNANATHTLLATGILDAVSAGILLYDGLVNVVYPHFADKSFERSSGVWQAAQLVAMYVGCGIMSLIGYWA